MKKLFGVLGFAAFFAFCMRQALAFDVIKDIEQQTQWTLGNSVAAGTAIDLKNGQFDGSALAQIAQYRFLSGWFGGTFIPQSDKTLRAIDTAKLGFNLGYLFRNFVNQPPELIKNLVIGPSIASSIFTTPRTLQYFFDANFSFGAPPASPQNPTPVPVKAATP